MHGGENLSEALHPSLFHAAYARVVVIYSLRVSTETAGAVDVAIADGLLAFGLDPQCGEAAAPACDALKPK